VAAQFALPVHHRVPEGLMKCSDCHNAHGTANRSNLRQAGSETCTNCHMEKHGPFVYEHSAIKENGCVTCHTPHGSSNRMLLIRREGRQLCMGCHVNLNANGGPNGQAGTPHGRKSFQTSGECVRCHVAIHGSNFDPTLLR
jgi:DmsE family decaheme c-type cytochrome